MHSTTEIFMEEAIEEAVDKAYVLFDTFGWEYFDGPPDRKRLEEMLRGRIDTVLDDEETQGAASGRFYVHRYSDGEIGLFLDLASFWVENDN